METVLYILSGIVLCTMLLELVPVVDGIYSSTDLIRRTPAFGRRYKKALKQRKAKSS